MTRLFLASITIVSALAVVPYAQEGQKATPALVDGRWYWRTETQLLCIGNKK